MNFFKKLFGQKKSTTSCSGCCCGTNLFSEIDAAILKNVDEKIVVGKVISVSAHPDPKMTKVRVTKTEISPGKIEQILCGGVNIKANACVPVALVGAKLSENFEIGEREIRGEVSRGMICSREELGLNKNDEPDHGIWILGDEFSEKLGTPIQNL